MKTNAKTFSWRRLLLILDALLPLKQCVVKLLNKINERALLLARQCTQCEISLQIFQSQKTCQMMYVWNWKLYYWFWWKCNFLEPFSDLMAEKCRKILLLKVLKIHSNKLWALRPKKKAEEEKRYLCFSKPFFPNI